MNDIPRDTILEVVGNPTDLCVSIWSSLAVKGFGFLIFRSPKSGLKPLVGSVVTFKTADEAAEGIKTLLQEMREYAVSVGLCDDDPSQMMSLRMIELIVHELRASRVARTYEFPPPR